MAIWRDGQTRELSVLIQENLDARISGHRLDPRLQGLVLVTVPDSQRLQGVVVEEVRRNTPTWQTGLRSGDLVVALNGRRVEDLKDFRSRFPLEASEPLTLEIRRRGTIYRVPLGVVAP